MTYDLYVDNAYYGSFGSEAEARAYTDAHHEECEIEVFPVPGIEHRHGRFSEAQSAVEDDRSQLTKLLADPQDAEIIGQAIADLLDLPRTEYPIEELRFDTVICDKTYEGLARTIARIFEDSSFRVICNEKWEDRNPNGRRTVVRGDA